MRNNSSLYHFGIMGMKWGIRRYQNPDGSYTAEGQRRRSKKEKKLSARQEAKNLSSEELRKRIERRRLEDAYIEQNSRTILNGKNFIENTLLIVTTAALTEYMRGNASDIVKKGARFIKNIGAKHLKKAVNIAKTLRR